MIRVGDYVRLSNAFLSWNKRKTKRGRLFRRPNRIFRVTRIIDDNGWQVRHDPRKRYNQIVELDVYEHEIYPERIGEWRERVARDPNETPLSSPPPPDRKATISTHWLRFVRRRQKANKRQPKKPKPPKPRHEKVRELQID